MQSEEENYAQGDDQQCEARGYKQRVKGICTGHDGRGEQTQVKVIVVCQIGHLAGQYLQVVGLASAVEHLPVGHDDLAEQPSAKRVDEGLLVPGVEDRFPVLHQSAECQQRQVNRQDASQGDRYAGSVSKITNGEGNPVRFPASDAQQLQKRYEQHDGEPRGYSLHKRQQEYQPKLPRLMPPQQVKRLNKKQVFFQ